MIRENHMVVRGIPVFRCRHTDAHLRRLRPGTFYTAPEALGFLPFRSESEIRRAIKEKVE